MSALRSKFFWLALVLAAAAIVVFRFRASPRQELATESHDSRDVAATAPAHHTESTEHAASPASSSPSNSSVPSIAAVQRTSETEMDSDTAALLSPDFKSTTIYERWHDSGVTDDDVSAALVMMKERGFSGAQLRDAALISQFLPARNIQPVYVENFSLPSAAQAGQPVEFALEASYPSPAYTFDRWDIRYESSVVVIRPIGSRSAEPVASVLIPVTLKGTLSDLKPGTYTVRLEAIGAPIEKQLHIE